MKGGAIRLEKLVKSFDGVPAVTGIDLDIPAGQFYSLLGASGCGKTTTLRMIAGFEKPDSGRIELDGRDVQAIHRINVPSTRSSRPMHCFRSCRCGTTSRSG